MQRITGALQSVSEDLCAVVDLRDVTRRHVWLATGAAASAGFLAGPLVPQALRRMLLATAGVATMATRGPWKRNGLVLTSALGLRARRWRSN